jgi:hypothetical protein
MHEPQMTTMRFAFMIAWIALDNCALTLLLGTKNAGCAVASDEGSKGTNIVMF